MSLLDLNIKKFIIKTDVKPEEGFSFTAKIYQENETPVGKIQLTGGLKSVMSLIDNTGSTIISSKKKLSPLGAKYEVKDSQDNPIGVASEKGTFKKKFVLKNTEKKEIVSIGTKKKSEITDSEGNKIGNFELQEDRENNRVSCSLNFENSDTERIFIFGVFLSMLSWLTDSAYGAENLRV